MKFKLKNILLFLFIAGNSETLLAQVLPVGTPFLEDYYRRQQLLGKLDSSLSFSVRPLDNAFLDQDDLFDPLGNNSTHYGRLLSDGSRDVQLLPVIWQNQWTSGYPYGGNDGAMVPAVGYQTKVSAGIYTRYKFLSVQLMPEFVFAQNLDFQGFEGSDKNYWQKWYKYMNRIDAPERFGTSAYARVFPGQSSIRFNFNPISFGISTENLWWGPGQNNSLMMSNNAPGFLHGTLNTTRPVHTGLGSFEGQLAIGRLDASGFTPTPLGNPSHYDELYRQKPDGSRYFSGIVLSYQPKWVPGLSLGLINVFTVYTSDMGNKLGDYIPFFKSNSRSTSNPGTASDDAAQDRNASAFFRWVIPAAQFEIYGEYARNDHSWNIRDFISFPAHSRSYTFGLQKLVLLNPLDQLRIRFEMTQSSQAKTAELRKEPGNPMYLHYVVKDGYTQLGQVLGSGAGFGNDVQNLDIDWIRDEWQAGLQVERLVHLNDLFYDLYRDSRRHWVDLGFAARGAYHYKNFIFTAKFQYFRLLNYQWQIEARPEQENPWKFYADDRNNLQLQAGMMYRF